MADVVVGHAVREGQGGVGGTHGVPLARAPVWGELRGQRHPQLVDRDLRCEVRNDGAHGAAVRRHKGHVQPCRRNSMRGSMAIGRRSSANIAAITTNPPHPPRDAPAVKGPRRQPQKRLDRRLQEGAKAVGGGYCRLQMPLKLALAVRETVAGHRLGAPRGMEGASPSLPMHPCPPPPPPGGPANNEVLDKHSPNGGCSLDTPFVTKAIWYLNPVPNELGP